MKSRAASSDSLEPSVDRSPVMTRKSGRSRATVSDSTCTVRMSWLWASQDLDLTTLDVAIRSGTKCRSESCSSFMLLTFPSFSANNDACVGTLVDRMMNHSTAMDLVIGSMTYGNG